MNRIDFAFRQSRAARPCSEQVPVFVAPFNDDVVFRNGVVAVVVAQHVELVRTEDVVERIAHDFDQLAVARDFLAQFFEHSGANAAEKLSRFFQLVSEQRNVGRNRAREDVFNAADRRINAVENWSRIIQERDDREAAAECFELSFKVRHAVEESRIIACILIAGD